MVSVAFCFVFCAGFLNNGGGDRSRSKADGFVFLVANHIVDCSSRVDANFWIAGKGDYESRSRVGGRGNAVEEA